MLMSLTKPTNGAPIAMPSTAVTRSLRVCMIEPCVADQCCRPCTRTRRCSLQRKQRFPFFNDIRSELGGGGGPNVLYLVNCSVRDEQNLAGFQRHRRLSLELVLERTFDDIDHLFAWM